MAATYTPEEALDYARSLVQNMPVDDATEVRYRIMDDAQKMIWNAAPWRWSVLALGPVTLVSDTTSYTISPSSTCFRIVSAYATDGKVTKPLATGYTTASTPSIAAPIQQVTLASATNLRVWPAPGEMTDTWTVLLTLKKISPVISVSNEGTGGALVMDDEYFPVYQEWVNYYAMRWAFDGRAGGAQVDPQTGKITYTGQLGVAYAYLEEMRRRENISPEMDYRPDLRQDKR